MNRFELRVKQKIMAEPLKFPDFQLKIHGSCQFKQVCSSFLILLKGGILFEILIKPLNFSDFDFDMHANCGFL